MENSSLKMPTLKVSIFHCQLYGELAQVNLGMELCKSAKNKPV
jgi:hypothetical protein